MIPPSGKASLVGMIHTGPLPGAPRPCPGLDGLAGPAAREARVYADHGFDAVLVENIHDLPYLPPDDAFIVGSSVKQGGDWRNPVDPARVRALAAAAGRGDWPA